MNKSELIAAIAETSGSSKNSANEFLDALVKVTTECLQEGGQITLPGVGSIAVANRAERAGRNPRTGETMTIPASRTAKFKIAKGLKEALNS